MSGVDKSIGSYWCRVESRRGKKNKHSNFDAHAIKDAVVINLFCDTNNNFSINWQLKESYNVSRHKVKEILQW